uniref:FecR family protein n=1 Tax=Pedobacter schmidteae TaxID=2201271 RepID=UPI000EB41107|nr:FecR domain-containing protein [Pedobacter schmidteae]
MNNKEARELLDKYIEGGIGTQERAWVDHWYLNEASGRTLNDDQSFEHLNEEIWKEVLERAGLRKRNKTLRIWMTSAAAIFLLIMGIGLLIQNVQNGPGKIKTRQLSSNIKPGSNKAMLTLGNGKKIVLNDIPVGKVIKQEGISITKTSDGELIYSMSNSEANQQDKKNTFNVIETPKGGQYQVNLPDGTKVWLNSASTLKYPTSFSPLERRVELSGEGYFEVAHMARRPFKVIVDRQEIRVLGTHFDINAYKEGIGTRTTLVSGSVKVTELGKSVVLKPGEQSLFKNDVFAVNEANIEMILAWKNGFFMFKNTSLQELMNQLSRWYDIEVEYEGEIPKLSFNGKLYRNTSLDETLKLLEFSKVKFKIEGKKMRILSQSKAK